MIARLAPLTLKAADLVDTLIGDGSCPPDFFGMIEKAELAIRFVNQVI